jgi:RimJ/RimL family protein N-acetyltransferase
MLGRGPDAARLTRPVTLALTPHSVITDVWGKTRLGLAAGGNLTPFRGHPADTGLLTHPAARGRGLAKQIAVQMIQDALSAAGIIRYRALISNSPSLAIARALGFAGCGQNLIARLPA